MCVNGNSEWFCSLKHFLLDSYFVGLFNIFPGKKKHIPVNGNMQKKWNSLSQVNLEKSKG